MSDNVTILLSIVAMGKAVLHISSCGLGGVACLVTRAGVGSRLREARSAAGDRL